MRYLATPGIRISDSGGVRTLGKRREGVRLPEPHVAIAVGESDYQFPAAARAEVKRLEFNRRLIREAGFRQTAAQRQKGSNQSNTEGGLREVRCDFHRFDWHQS